MGHDAPAPRSRSEEDTAKDGNGEKGKKSRFASTALRSWTLMVAVVRWC